jgi:hypothetical protein
MRPTAALPLALVAMTALSCADAVEEGPQPGARTAAITYGQVDTTHPAVVFIFQELGQAVATCGGTIVAVKGETGFLLTAAHCVAKLAGPTQLSLPPEPASTDTMAVVMDADYMTASPSVKEVFEVALHPEFDGLSHAHDFAMVRFGKIDPATVPIAPLAPSEDQLQVGTMIELVGYGATETSTHNSVRRHIDKPIASLDGDLIEIDQSGTSGGACEGDSGGPALTLDSPQRVAGVVSGGTSCTGTAELGRVSSAYDGFIAPFIDDATGAITCTECLHSSYQSGAPCAEVFRICYQDPDGVAYSDCLKGCDPGDAGCSQGCSRAHPDGAELYAAAMRCVCDTACATECAGDARCLRPPACGIAMPDAACAACAEEACCAEERTCAADDACAPCAGAATAAVSCAGSAAYRALRRCLGESCAADCGESPCGYAGTSDCRLCVEAHCCETSLACSLDGTCDACRSAAAPGPECADNAGFRAWTSCVDATCTSACTTELPSDSVQGCGGCASAPATGGAWCGWVAVLALLGAAERRAASRRRHPC